MDLRLLEDGGERGDALGSDVVAPNTASEGQDGNDERVGVSMGADTKRTLYRAAAYHRVLIRVSLRTAASTEAPLTPMSLPLRLQARGRNDGNGERVGVSMGADTKANTKGRRRT